VSRSSSAGFPRPIDSTLHGVTDYSMGSMLMTVFPRLAGIRGTRAARQVRIAGAVHAGYSAMTDYPLGAVKVIPYKVHLLLDAVGALALGATPFVTGQFREGRRQWLPHVALCMFELGSLVLSDPKGDGDNKADVAAVREANMADPDAAIRQGGPAVRAAVAV
jgi:hypothetical protein